MHRKLISKIILPSNLRSRNARKRFIEKSSEKKMEREISGIRWNFDVTT